MRQQALPTKCPKCGSKKIEEDELVVTSRRRIDRPYRCQECHREWVVTYQLRGWDWRI